MLLYVAYEIDNNSGKFNNASGNLYNRDEYCRHRSNRFIRLQWKLIKAAAKFGVYGVVRVLRFGLLLSSYQRLLSFRRAHQAGHFMAQFVVANKGYLLLSSIRPTLTHVRCRLRFSTQNQSNLPIHAKLRQNRCRMILQRKAMSDLYA